MLTAGSFSHIRSNCPGDNAFCAGYFCLSQINRSDLVYIPTCEKAEDFTEIQTLACIVLIKVHLLMVCLRQTKAKDLHFTVIQKIQNPQEIFN